MRLPAKLSWVDWPEKLSGPASSRQAPGSPLPSIHLVKLQSPKRRERKKQLTEKNKTGRVEDGTGRDGVSRTSVSGFTKNPKSQPKRAHHIPPFVLCRLSLAAPIPEAGSPGGAGCHSRGQAPPARPPDLAAQDCSVCVLRIIFQNILQAPPTDTRNLLHAVP